MSYEARLSKASAHEVAEHTALDGALHTLRVLAGEMESLVELE